MHRTNVTLNVSMMLKITASSSKIYFETRFVQRKKENAPEKNHRKFAQTFKNNL